MASGQWIRTERTFMVAQMMTGTAIDVKISRNLIKSIIRHIYNEALSQSDPIPILIWKISREISPNYVKMLRECRFLPLNEAEAIWSRDSWLEGRPERQVALKSVKTRYQRARSAFPGTTYCYLAEVHKIIEDFEENNQQVPDHSI
ncbi:hypothetical protein HK096_010233, partial [Nowakowskiella sp. JEL0078]